MTLLLQLRQYNDITATSIAILGNLLLLFLVITEKKVTLKNISITLVPNSLIDLTNAFLTLLTQPQILVIDTNVYIVIGSPIYKLGFTFGTVLIWIYAAFLITALNAICIPFCIRYLIICRNIKVKVKQVIFLYCCLLLIFIVNLVLLIKCYPLKDYDNSALLNDFWLDEFPKGPIFVSIEIVNQNVLILCSTICISMSFSYSLVVYFSFKMVKKLQIHVLNHSNTKALSKQLNKALTIQAICPLMIGNIPFICMIFACILNFDEPLITLSLSFFLGWISVVHPIAAIFIITPYRQRVKAFLRFKEKTQPQASGIPTTKIFTKNESKASAIPEISFLNEN